MITRTKGVGAHAVVDLIGDDAISVLRVVDIVGKGEIDIGSLDYFEVILARLDCIARYRIHRDPSVDHRSYLRSLMQVALAIDESKEADEVLDEAV